MVRREIGGEILPELPEVEGVVRMLKPAVEHKTIQRVIVSPVIYASKAAGKEAIIKGQTPEAFIAAVEGMTIEHIERHAKYIFFTMSKNGGQQLIVNHLGMSGAWFHVAHPDDVIEGKFHKHMHVMWQLAAEEWLIYTDIRRFGELRLLREVADYPPLLAMAPEPFDDVAMDYFLEKCTQRKYNNKAIKAVIMDGQVVSGCGNIYATEALFRTKIHPGRKVSQIDKAQLRQLFQEIVAVLTESIAFGGSSISDYRNINGEAGGMQHHLQMYGMKKCPMCHTNTEQQIIAGRNSFYCPNCQR